MEKMGGQFDEEVEGWMEGLKDNSTEGGLDGEINGGMYRQLEAGLRGDSWKQGCMEKRIKQWVYSWMKGWVMI